MKTEVMQQTYSCDPRCAWIKDEDGIAHFYLDLGHMLWIDSDLVINEELKEGRP